MLKVGGGPVQPMVKTEMRLTAPAVTVATDPHSSTNTAMRRHNGLRRPPSPVEVMPARKRPSIPPPLDALAEFTPTAASCIDSECAAPVSPDPVSPGAGSAGLSSGFWSSIPLLTNYGIGFDGSSAVTFSFEGSGRERPQRPDRGPAHERRSIVQAMDTQVHESRRTRISNGDHHITNETVPSDPLDRRARKNLAETSVVELR